VSFVKEGAQLELKRLSLNERISTESNKGELKKPGLSMRGNKRGKKLVNFKVRGTGDGSQRLKRLNKTTELSCMHPLIKFQRIQKY